MPFFFYRILSGIIHCTQLSCLPSFLWLWQFFGISLYLMILTVWGMLVRLFCKIIPLPAFVWYFTYDESGEMDFGEEDVKGNCWFHQIISSVHAITLCLSTLYSLEGSHYSQPKLKKWGIMLASMRSGDSLMAQPRKNLPAVQETEEMWVWSVGQEDP